MRREIRPSQHALIAMAIDFTAYLLGQEELAKRINKVILFGSVARGDYETQSDVDLFIEADPRLERRIHNVLSLWEASKRAEEWHVLGIKNTISLKVGQLDKWPAIHRVVIADGIQLYGKYTEVPRGLKQYLLVTLKTPQMPGSKRVVLSRQLFGYTQRIGKKIYRSSGLVGQLGGQRIARGVFVLPVQSAPKLFEFLRRRRVAYAVREFWSD